MELSLATNISKFRKEKKLTQEKLAQLLNVTFAAVSKWERGVATPDLYLIAQMANIFNVSVDKLIGYNVKNNGFDAMVKELDKTVKDNNYPKSIELCEEIVYRYPNNFDAFHYSAQAFFYVGTKTNNKEYIRKSIELLQHALILVPTESESPEKNEITIQGEIAQSYLFLEENDKAIEIFKKHNVNGIYDPLIAYSTMQKKNFKIDEVKPYLSRAYSSSLNTIVDTMHSFSNYYEAIKEYDNGIQALKWLINILDSLKIDEKKITFFDKVKVASFSKISVLYYLNKDLKNAKDNLYKAYYLALKFDETPNYNSTNIKYVIEKSDDIYIDGLATTALDAIYKQIDKHKDLIDILEEIKNEEKQHN